MVLVGIGALNRSVTFDERQGIPGAGLVRQHLTVQGSHMFRKLRCVEDSVSEAPSKRGYAWEPACSVRRPQTPSILTHLDPPPGERWGRSSEDAQSRRESLSLEPKTKTQNRERQRTANS